MPEDAFAAFVGARLWPGVGRALGEAVLTAGIGAPDDVTVQRLAAVPRIGARQADRLVRTFAEAEPVYSAVEVLAGAGLPAELAAGAVAALGEDAAATLREDPWRLLEVPAVRPEQADALAAGLLTSPSRQDPRRCTALTEYALTRAARDGHTALPADSVGSLLAGLHVPDPEEALATAIRSGRVLSFPEDDLLGLERYAMAEEALAEGLARLLATAEPLCGPDGTAVVTDGLDDAQAAAVRAVAASGVSVLTGGPGTGKSRTVAAVAALAGVRHRRIALAAPTGRAAKRLEELCDAPAGTLHRLLGAQGTSGNFARGEHWPLDADVVVVDEASMLDVELAAALVDACADGTHLLLVGDPAQLPSIGAGRVLGDVLESATVPTTELRTLHRQSEGGAIATLATAVRAGDLPRVDDPTREVVVVPAADPQVAARRVVQLVADSIPRALGIPSAEVQVVTPVHRGAAGTAALNTALKAALNPGEGAHFGFDPGDRVVATANHLDDGFANGEVGVVTGTADQGLVVDFGAGPVTVAPRLTRDLSHGFAVTVHRAQGSEWPAVVVVLPPEAGGLLSRPLVYTAMTRAQRHLSVVTAAGAALPRAVRQVGARPRRTRLAALLAEQ